MIFMEPKADFPTHKLLMLVGAILLSAGVALWLSPGWFKWIGRLPGDIRVEREHFRLYMPITTMILFSLFFSVLFRLIRRFWGF